MDSDQVSYIDYFDMVKFGKIIETFCYLYVLSYQVI